MELSIDPTNHNVSELEEAIKDLDDAEELDAILEAEQEGEGRKTAIAAIETRLGELERSIVEERPRVRPIDEDEDEVLTFTGPDESRELSERLLNDLSGIRRTLEEARQSGGQFEARLGKLENEVGKLTAYTEALEEFLDDEGTARQVLDSVRDDLAAIEDDIDDVKPVVRSHAKTLRNHLRAVTDLQEELDGQQSTIAEIVDDYESLDARLEGFADQMAEIRDQHSSRLKELDTLLQDKINRLDEVAQQVQELDEWVNEELDEAAGQRIEITDSVESNAGAIAKNESETAKLAEDLNVRLGETDRVDGRFAQIEADLEELQMWRDQLGSVLSGGAGMEESAE